MYQFVKAVCLARTIGAQWKEVDLSNIIVHDIYTTYQKIFLVLHHTVTDEDMIVNFDEYRPVYSSYNNTLNELLIEIGNTTLNETSSLPNTEVKFAKYSDAIRSEYKLQTSIVGQVVPPNYPEEDKKDLIITRPKYTTDISLLHDYCLLSVNGFVHLTDTDGSVTYILQGAQTMRKSNHNQAGILSFYDIGKLNKVKIDPSKIIPQNTDDVLKNKLTFEVTAPLDNKSYIFILGGYMILPEEGTFWRSGEQLFTLDLQQLPYVERIFDSRHFLDLSSLGIQDWDNVNVNQIWSDEVIKKYFDLSQSFLVIIDTPNLVWNKYPIRKNNLPGMFTTYQDPVYPLIVAYGKMVEYWKVFEDNHWSVTVQDSFYRNYVINAQVNQELTTMNDHLQPNQPTYFSRGYLLELAGYRT